MLEQCQFGIRVDEDPDERLKFQTQRLQKCQSQDGFAIAGLRGVSSQPLLANFEREKRESLHSEERKQPKELDTSMDLMFRSLNPHGKLHSFALHKTWLVFYYTCDKGLHVMLGLQNHSFAEAREIIKENH
eukprot:2899644-Amphidinium_carterae.1